MCKSKEKKTATKLSATMLVHRIVDDLLTMFPQRNFMETMAVNAFKVRMLQLSEKQNEEIVEKVRRRLILNDQNASGQ